MADTPPVTPASENAQTTPAPAKTESNSTGSAVTVNAATSSVSAHGVVATEEQPSATVTESTAVPSLQASKLSAASNTPADQSVATAATRAASTAQITSSATGFVGLLNSIVVNLLNPFLTPAPNTPQPATPVTWAVLGWVRRNLFNQAPTINPNPTTTQTGQTVTGILATDPEGDRLTYTVTQPPENGTLTIDQATNTFTFTPTEINYDAPQDYSFRVSVADGKFNLLSLFRPHSDEETITVTVKPPTVEREILHMPEDITSPLNPRFSEDGKSIVFSASGDTGRGEVYRITVDGIEPVECMTCGVASPPVRPGVLPTWASPFPSQTVRAGSWYESETRGRSPVGTGPCWK